MVSEKNASDHGEENFYAALSHEIRRKIINIIGDEENTSFTKLKEVLEYSTGTIYHHLEVLRELVYQKKNKKYYLTSLGTHAYKFLQQNIDTLESTKITDEKIKSPFVKGILNFTPKKLFLEDPQKYPLALVISITTLLACTILAGLSGMVSFVLFFQEYAPTPALLSADVQFISSIVFVINFFIFFGLTELFCYIFYEKSENSLKILLNLGTIYFPILIYLVIHYIIFVFELTFLSILDDMLLIFFQIWSLWLLTYNLSVNKYIKIERALIVSLLIHYGSFIVLFIIRI